MTQPAQRQRARRVSPVGDVCCSIAVFLFLTSMWRNGIAFWTGAFISGTVIAVMVAYFCHRYRPSATIGAREE